jgi:hypothetical protein
MISLRTRLLLTMVALLVVAAVSFPTIASAQTAAPAKRKQVRVFVALCDNQTQGIVPVGAKIGNGNDADANLYWGCSDGLGTYFRRTAKWQQIKAENDPSPTILCRLELRSAGGDMDLTAEAYRGSEMKQCLIDFEAAAASGHYDLVAYIGHNGLMDFTVPPPSAVPGNQTDVIVLCCVSEKFFGDRLRSLGCRPVLMTQQLMYPGAFLLHAALTSWSQGGTAENLRTAAAAAYAKNQKIPVRAATGVFAPALKR